MNLDTMHLTAFALESSGAAAMAIGSVYTLTIPPGHCPPHGWPLAGLAGVGPAAAAQAAAAFAPPQGLTITFPL